MIATRNWDEATVLRMRWWTLTVLCLSFVIIAINVMTLTVAVPELIVVFGATTSQIQWVVAIYSIAFAAFVITAGAISDRFGRKRILLTGLILFGVISGVGAFAQTAQQLTIARAGLGLAAAMIMPGTLSILVAVFPVEERGKAIGIWNSVASIGFVAGPLVGGALLAAFWWGSIMIANIPLVLVALVSGYFLLPESKDPDGRPLDPIGAVLSAVGLASLVYAFVEAPQASWSSLPVLTSIALALAAFVVFALWELRFPHPMLDVRVFKIRTLTIPTVVLLLAFVCLFGLTYILPQYSILVEGDSELVAGALLIPSSIAWSISSLFVFRFVERFGYRLVITAGLAIGAVGFAVLLGVSAGPSELIVVLAMAVIGTGLGTATTPASVLLVSALPQEKAGVGSAINDVTREAGTAIGVAIFGSVLAAVYTTTMSGNTAELAASQADVAKDSLPGALAVAGRIGGKVGEELSAAATAAFDSGVHLVVAICVATVAALALLTYFFIGEDRPTS